tara:strand:- start:594 stop:875 length:282 start_codon:yes stop_codon:yes gene_type:complete
MIEQSTQIENNLEIEEQENININIEILTPEQQRRETLERMYEIHGIGKGDFLNTIKSYYYLTFGYITNYQKYKLYWEVTEFLYEKKYGKKYGD